MVLSKFKLKGFVFSYLAQNGGFLNFVEVLWRYKEWSRFPTLDGYFNCVCVVDFLEILIYHPKPKFLRTLSYSRAEQNIVPNNYIFKAGISYFWWGLQLENSETSILFIRIKFCMVKGISVKNINKGTIPRVNPHVICRGPCYHETKSTYCL